MHGPLQLWVRPYLVMLLIMSKCGQDCKLRAVPCRTGGAVFSARSDLLSLLDKGTSTRSSYDFWFAANCMHNKCASLTGTFCLLRSLLKRKFGQFF